MNRLLNKKEVGEFMNVSIGKVDLMMSDGLKYIKMNRNVRFRMEDINEYINQKVVLQKNVVVIILYMYISTLRGR